MTDADLVTVSDYLRTVRPLYDVLGLVGLADNHQKILPYSRLLGDYQRHACALFQLFHFLMSRDGVTAVTVFRFDNIKGKKCEDFVEEERMNWVVDH
jgi:hypothetical protein